MRRLLVLLLLVLAGCGSSSVTATRLTKDRPLGDGGGTLRVPAAALKATVSPGRALAICRKDGSCLKSRPTIELADVTTSTGLRDRLAYVLTFRHNPCVSAGPVASRPPTTCTNVAVVDARSGAVGYQFDFSES
jgi:hypothetical protein